MNQLLLGDLLLLCLLDLFCSVFGYGLVLLLASVFISCIGRAFCWCVLLIVVTIKLLAWLLLLMIRF